MWSIKGLRSWRHGKDLRAKTMEHSFARVFRKPREILYLAKRVREFSGDHGNIPIVRTLDVDNIMVLP